MANFSDIFPLVLPEVPQCSNLLAKSHIVRATRELCRESKIWTVTDFLVPFSGVGKYLLTDAISIPVYSEINMVESVSQAGGNLSPVELIEINKATPDWRTETSDQASNYIMENRRTLYIYPKPTAQTVDNLSITVSLRPTLSADIIDSDVYADWAEAISYGALYTLMLIQEKAWSNIKLSAFYHDKFLYWLEKAKQDTIRGYSNIDLIVRVE